MGFSTQTQAEAEGWSFSDGGTYGSADTGLKASKRAEKVHDGSRREVNAPDVPQLLKAIDSLETLWASQAASKDPSWQAYKQNQDDQADAEKQARSDQQAERVAVDLADVKSRAAVIRSKKK
jgi:hypothetical protein